MKLSNYYNMFLALHMQADRRPTHQPSKVVSAVTQQSRFRSILVQRMLWLDVDLSVAETR